MLETLRLSRARDLAIGFVPEVFVGGVDLAHRLADGIHETRLPSKGRIHFQNEIIDRATLIVVQHLDRAEGLVERVGQSPMQMLAFSQALRQRVRAVRVQHPLLASRGRRLLLSHSRPNVCPHCRDADSWD